MSEQLEKSHVLNEVALPHAARLLQKAPEPLEPDLLHPSRRAPSGASYHVKGTPDAHHERDIQALQVALDEVFFLRRANPDKQDVRLDVADRFNQLFLVCRCPIA